jgi:hypothetical protein
MDYDNAVILGQQRVSTMGARVLPAAKLLR